MKKYIVYIIVLLIGMGVFLLQFGYTKKFQPTTVYQVYLDNEKIGVIKSKEELESYIGSQGELIKKQVSDYKEKIDRIDVVRSILKKVINKNSTFYDNYKKLLEIENAYNIISKYTDEKGNITNYEYVSESYNKLDNNILKESSLSDDKINEYGKLISNIDSNIKSINLSLINALYERKDNLKLTSREYSFLEDYVKNNLNDINYSKFISMKKYVSENEIYLHTSNIYEPLGINIKRLTTYKNNTEDIKKVYSKIIEKKPCTIEGYRFKIKKSNNTTLTDKSLLGALALNDYKKISNVSTDDLIIYVTSPKIFNDAIDEMTSIFIGDEEYESYKNNEQKAIKTTGSKIENVYLKEEITFKATNISIKEKIFTDSSSLASYLLYGENSKTKIVYASSKDSISSLAYKNGISVEEFFLSNPSFTSINNMFYNNQPITITKLNPKLSLIVEESQIVDKSIDYKKVEKYDNTMNKGDEVVEQKGKKGLMRVSQNVKKVNGQISLVTPVSNETIKNAQDEIIKVGTKEIPNVGSVGSWGWPTNSGYTLSSYFGWRSYPFNPGAREFHAGLDIAGTGYGSPVYASNNGTIEIMRSDRWNYGTHIILNHHNGYWTTYGHMSRFAKGLKVGSTVSRGQIIGYVGSSGAATGPHLHFEIRVGENRYSNVVDPLPYLNK